MAGHDNRPFIGRIVELSSVEYGVVTMEMPVYGSIYIYDRPSHRVGRKRVVSYHPWPLLSTSIDGNNCTSYPVRQLCESWVVVALPIGRGPKILPNNYLEVRRRKTYNILCHVRCSFITLSHGHTEHTWAADLHFPPGIPVLK